MTHSQQTPPTGTDITDEQLILLYYGELEDAELARKVATTPALNARFEALSQQLSVLDKSAIPSRSENYGRLVWARISAEIDTTAEQSAHKKNHWLQFLFQPRWSLASLSGVIIVATVAFWLGGRTNHGNSVELLALESRPLQQVAVEYFIERHLDDAERWLTQVSNEKRSPRITSQSFFTGAEPRDHAESIQSGVNPTWSNQLLQRNRLYRKSLQQLGAQATTFNPNLVARVLDDLEFILLQHANQARPNIASMTEQSKRLLFQLRVVKRQADVEPEVKVLNTGGQTHDQASI